MKISPREAQWHESIVLNFSDPQMRTYFWGHLNIFVNPEARLAALILLKRLDEACRFAARLNRFLVRRVCRYCKKLVVLMEEKVKDLEARIAKSAVIKWQVAS